MLWVRSRADANCFVASVTCRIAATKTFGVLASGVQQIATEVADYSKKAQRQDAR